MSISIDEVERIAKLARLEVGNNEKQKLQEEMSSILNYVDQLKEVQDKATDFVDEIASVNLMRDDVAEPKENPKEFIAQAPSSKDGFVQVKSILE